MFCSNGWLSKGFSLALCHNGVSDQHYGGSLVVVPRGKFCSAPGQVVDSTTPTLSSSIRNGSRPTPCRLPASIISPSIISC